MKKKKIILLILSDFFKWNKKWLISFHLPAYIISKVLMKSNSSEKPSEGFLNVDQLSTE